MKLIKAVFNAAKTGKNGDGKVFVLPAESAVRIRTEEADGEALSSRGRGTGDRSQRSGF